MILENSKYINDLIGSLGKTPVAAERFKLNNSLEVDIFKLKDIPYEGATTIFTNGARLFNESINLEFLFTFYEDDVPTSFDGFAFMATYLELHFMKNAESVDVSSFFEVPGRLIKEFNFSGLYTAQPCYFNQDEIYNSIDPKLLWLVPIFKEELDFLKKFGASLFESKLELIDPDLCDLNRKSII